jgi:hypothetical protein
LLYSSTKEEAALLAFPTIFWGYTCRISGLYASLASKYMIVCVCFPIYRAPIYRQNGGAIPRRGSTCRISGPYALLASKEAARYFGALTAAFRGSALLASKEAARYFGALRAAFWGSMPSLPAKRLHMPALFRGSTCSILGRHALFASREVSHTCAISGLYLQHFGAPCLACQQGGFTRYFGAVPAAQFPGCFICFTLVQTKRLLCLLYLLYLRYFGAVPAAQFPGCFTCFTCAAVRQHASACIGIFAFFL